MKIALFVDFDNVYSGLRRISAEAAERFSRQPLRWLQWLTADDATRLDGAAGGPARVLVRRCYLNPVMYQKYRRPFHEAGFEIVDCPPMTASGKTSTDIHLVLDTMDALMDATHFDAFIVFSADADFSPVLRRLRRHDRRTVVFAAGAMSESYKASADRVIDIPTFLRDALDIGAADDEDELPQHNGTLLAAPAGSEVRAQIAALIRRHVLQAQEPVSHPALAHLLQREMEGLRESHWDGAGSFGALLRQLQVPDVDFDFDARIAIDRQRYAHGGMAQTPPFAADSDHNSAALPTLSPQALDEAAAQIVREAVAASAQPVHLATLGQILRRSLPQLAHGWAGAPSFAAFLQRLHIEPLQRCLLDNGTTAVLYDPARHEAPSGVVGDPWIVGVLRAAELPEMRGPDLVRILAHARPHMGGSAPFEIAEVSRNVAATMVAEGRTIAPRRVSNVLQAMIFGGLDATQAYEQEQDLLSAAMGVILSAWARETQAIPDDEARQRLLAWLAPQAETDTL